MRTAFAGGTCRGTSVSGALRSPLHRAPQWARVAMHSRLRNSTLALNRRDLPLHAMTRYGEPRCGTLADGAGRPRFRIGDIVLHWAPATLTQPRPACFGGDLIVNRGSMADSPLAECTSVASNPSNCRSSAACLDSDTPSQTFHRRSRSPKVLSRRFRAYHATFWVETALTLIATVRVAMHILRTCRAPGADALWRRYTICT